MPADRESEPRSEPDDGMVLPSPEPGGGWPEPGGPASPAGGRPIPDLPSVVEDEVRVFEDGD